MASPVRTAVVAGWGVVAATRAVVWQAAREAVPNAMDKVSTICFVFVVLKV